MPRGGRLTRLWQCRESDVTEELEVLAIVTERLEAAEIPYMVTGSFAASYDGAAEALTMSRVAMSLTSGRRSGYLATGNRAHQS
jgi:hypothetical protein